MNLVDLVKRKDRALIEVADGIEPCVHRCGDVSMHALRLPTSGVLRIAELPAFEEMKVPPRWTGWAAAADRKWIGRRGKTSLRLAVDIGPGDETVEVARCELDASAGSWTPLRCDWPVRMLGARDVHLVVAASGDADGAAFLGIAEVVDLRGPILALAKGDGIEIGPGTSPQVMPGRDVRVRYLEQYSVEDWSKLYPKMRLEDVPRKVRDLWQYYIVGNAQQLENIDDGSLDFVFSSHVFEHLVNPLGTLEVWRRKLRPGGRVLGVTPDANNCFDLRQPLSREAEWLTERDRAVWSFEDRHYQKWVRYTEPRVTVESLEERGYSVHAHYYTPPTFARLLGLAVEQLGYAGFHIRSTPNNKDFAWVLQS